MRERLRQRLHELDERLADVPVPPALERRIMASIGEQSGGRVRVVVGLAVLASLLLAFALGLRMRADVVPAPPPTVVVAPQPIPIPTPAPAVAVAIAPATAWGGALTFDPQCASEVEGELVRVAGGCRMVLAEPALVMDAWSPTRLARARDGVRIVDGEVELAVAHVAEGAPRVRVEVDAGAIEVLGTRFAVVQEGTSGHVDLLEGAIAFVGQDGTEHAVVPGRRLRWTAGAVVPATRSGGPGTSTEHAPGKSAIDLDATLESVAALRRAGRFRDAVALLHRVRRELGDAPGAEILAFEEGTLREHDDTAPAMCAFWRGHLARFPRGEYVGAVRSRLARAGCEDP